MYERRATTPLTVLCSMLGASACSEPWVTVELAGPAWPPTVHVSVTHQEDERFQLGKPFNADTKNGNFSFHIPKASGHVRLVVSAIGEENCRTRRLVETFPAAGSDTGLIHSLHSDALEELSPHRCNCEGGWCRVTDAAILSQSWNSVNGRQTVGTKADIWIVGEKNQYVFWNGTVWTPGTVGNSLSDSPIQSTLYDGTNDYAAGRATIRVWVNETVRWREDIFAMPVGDQPLTRHIQSIWSAQDKSNPKYLFAGYREDDNRSPLHALIISGPNPVKLEQDGVYPPLHGIWGFDRSEVWGVGVNGTIIRQNGEGTSWYKPENIRAESIKEANPNLYSIWGIRADTGPNRMWTAGSSGTLWRWQDSTWSAESIATKTALSNETIHAVWGRDFRDVWAVGTNGLILHYDGQTWAQMETPAMVGNTTFHGIWGPDRESIWIVGDNGTVLVRDP